MIKTNVFEFLKINNSRVKKFRKKTLVENTIRQNEKKRFSFCNNSETTGPKTIQFLKSLLKKQYMNPLSKFKKIRDLPAPKI